MLTMSLVKPINYAEIKNLDMTRYILLYFDENYKLKRAIPDFDEKFISKEDSLINEALTADRVGLFKLLPSKVVKREDEVIFTIIFNENGEVIRHNNCYDNVTKIDNFILDSERREKVSKLLKKRR